MDNYVSCCPHLKLILVTKLLKIKKSDGKIVMMTLIKISPHFPLSFPSFPLSQSVFTISPGH